jgi:hypothetical protein
MFLGIRDLEICKFFRGSSLEIVYWRNFNEFLGLHQVNVYDDTLYSHTSHIFSDKRMAVISINDSFLDFLADYAIPYSECLFRFAVLSS